jgi:hypothetical protein
MYYSLQQIFHCLLCCFLNPDEDICTVPSNRYSIVYCVVSSSSGMIKRHNRQLKYPLEGTVHMSSSGLREQQKRQLKYLLQGIIQTYVLFPPTDIPLSIVLFPQSRWRHMYCSLQQIFHLSIVLFSQSRWRHMYCSFQQIFD